MISRGFANPYREYSEQLPQQLIQRREKIASIAFNPAQPNVIVLTSLGFVCAVDLEKVPAPVRQVNERNRGADLLEHFVLASVARSRCRTRTPP